MATSAHLMHSQAIVVNVFAAKGRVFAVEWAMHDPFACDGNHLSVETEGWRWCPNPLCFWQFDPEGRCPIHGERGDA